VFERFSGRVSKVMCLAYAESERLHHDYVGPEHVLAGLAQQDDSRAAAILAGSGLGPGAVRAGLDHLVALGMLPGPWRSKAELLGSLGIDLAAVRRAAEDSFGVEAVSAASRRVRSRSLLRAEPFICTDLSNPLSGKVMLTKRAFELARQEADGLGQHEIRTGHLLLGVLRDAEDPLGTGLSRRARRMGSQLGLSPGGPSPVRLVVEDAGLRLEILRARVMAAQHGGPGSP
jgi:hypothetical protein